MRHVRSAGQLIWSCVPAVLLGGVGLSAAISGCEPKREIKIKTPGVEIKTEKSSRELDIQVTQPQRKADQSD